MASEQQINPQFGSVCGYIRESANGNDLGSFVFRGGGGEDSDSGSFCLAKDLVEDASAIDSLLEQVSSEIVSLMRSIGCQWPLSITESRQRILGFVFQLGLAVVQDNQQTMPSMSRAMDLSIIE